MKIHPVISLAWQGESEVQPNRQGFLESVITQWLLWDKQHVTTFSEEDDFPDHDALMNQISDFQSQFDSSETVLVSLHFLDPEGVNTRWELRWRDLPNGSRVVWWHDTNPMASGIDGYFIGK